MALNLLTDRQYCAPSAADGVTLTPSGTSWGNSSWVELLTSADAALILSGLTLSTNLGDNIWDFGIEVDVGTGAAGSETVIATVRAHDADVFSTATAPSLSFPLPIGIDNIATAARVATRIRTGTTNTTPWRVAISYYKKPLSSGSTYLSTAAALKALPAAASPVTITTAGTAWANGSWAEIRAASGAALDLVGAVITGATGVFEVDLGTGTSGSETVITTLRLATSGVSTKNGWFSFALPLDNIAASTRVAARVRGSATSTALKIALLVLEKPL